MKKKLLISIAAGVLCLCAGVGTLVGCLIPRNNSSVSTAETTLTQPKDTSKYWGDEGTGYDIDWAGSGTENDPYLITSAAELAGLSYRIYNDNVKNESEKTVSGSVSCFYSGVYFKQTRNLDLSNYWWQPIGAMYLRDGTKFDSARAFAGNFDGDRHIISGMFTNVDNSLTSYPAYLGNSYRGLFGYVYGASSANKATIQKIGVVDSIIVSGSYGAGVAGYAYNANITDCFNEADLIKGNSNSCAGILGEGASSVTISNCYNKGNINVPSLNDVGGIVGRLTYGTIMNCYNLGDVTGYSGVGSITAAASKVINCYNLGTINGRSVGSGIVCGSSSYKGQAINCINMGSTKYAIIGKDYRESYGTAVNCYYGGNCTSTNDGTSANNSIKIEDINTTTYAKNKDWYTDSANWSATYPWDFENVWAIDKNYNDGFPVFKWQIITNWSQLADTEWEGDGLTPETAYKIDTPEKLAGLSVQVKAGNTYSGKYFKQTADISLGGYEWVAIGDWTAGSSSNGKYFAGSFDGQGHTITSLTVRDKTECEHGLFGWVRGGTVKNVKMKNILINTAVEAPTGAIVGVLSDNAVLNNCQVNGATITSNSRVGGLVGFAINGVSVLNSSFNGDVTSIGWWAAGGITGVLQDGKIENCLSSGRIKAVRADAGGLSGTSQGTLNVISNCISYCIVESGCTLGGLVARGSAKIINCSCYGLLSYDPSKAYNLTADYGTESARYIGGIYGYVSSNDYVNMENCVFYGSGDSLTDIQPFYEGENCSVTSSYSVINGKGYYSDGDFSGWAIISGMNDNLPMQKALYAVAQFGETLNASWFDSQGFEKI